MPNLSSPTDLAENAVTNSVSIINRTTGLEWKIPLIAIPEISVVIITTKNERFDIKNVVAFSVKNSLGLNIPKSQVTFSLDADEKVPSIGPLDEIYVYVQTFDLAAVYSSALDNFNKDLLFRCYTGLIDRVHQVFDTKIGKVYQIEMSTNMKKFAITSEYRPLSGYDSDTSVQIAFSTDSVYVNQATFKDPADLVAIACQQSNVAASFIYRASDHSALTPSTPLPNRINEPNDIITDKFGIGIYQQQYPFKSLIPEQLNYAYWQFDKWATILARVASTSFMEMFFSKYGQFYFRQLGMFRAKGSYDISVPSTIIESFDIFETDETIVTRLELRWTGGPFNPSPQNGFVWTPPNLKELESRYGPRYERMDVPWAVISASKLNGLTNLQDGGLTVLQDWIKAFATFVLAQGNANAIQGTVKLYGCNAFEVGQTIYLQDEGIVCYITDVNHTYKIGDGFFTILTVGFGRAPDLDFLQYLNVGAGVLGNVTSAGLIGVTDLNNAENPNQNTTLISGSTSDDDVLNQPLRFRGNPFFNGPNVIVTQGYGTNAEAFNSSDGFHHTGVDLVPSSDGGCTPNTSASVTPVVAGRVVQVATSSFGSGVTKNDHDGWGNFVIVRSDATDPILDFAYCHLATIGVKMGDTVVPQQTILGTMGSTGNSSGAHLHFQIQTPGGYEPDWVFAHTIDPAKFLSVTVVPAPCSKYSLTSFQTQSNVPKGFSLSNKKYCPNGNSLSQCASPLQNYLIDDNYTSNIRNWAQSICQNLKANHIESQAFMMAFADEEVGRGQLLIQPYNYGNIGAYDGYIGAALSFISPHESAICQSNLFLSTSITKTELEEENTHSRYAKIVDYLRNFTSPFNAAKVGELFLSTGYKTNAAYPTIINNYYIPRLQQLQGIS